MNELPENTAKYDRKLDDVLAAAAAVFAEKGFDQASIRNVAERAGLSVAGLYYYVRSKEEALFQIQYRAFDELVAQYQAQSADFRDPRDRLRLLVRNHLERFLKNISELAVCSRELGRLDGELGQRIQDKQREYFRLALKIFGELREAHGATRTSARTAALAMFGSINWVHTWYRPASGTAPGRLADDFIELCLHGYLSRSQEKPARSTAMR